jgi:hypothetical protein
MLYACVFLLTKIIYFSSALPPCTKVQDAKRFVGKGLEALDTR